jgi:four helix bundle protein
MSKTQAGTTGLAMNNDQKQYDLEDRTFRFARDIRVFVKGLPRNICNLEDGKQLVRASGSVGANYIEGNEALSKKDFQLRIKICRKEAKESRYWLKLVDTGENKSLEADRMNLIAESTELMKIFAAILHKSH